MWNFEFIMPFSQILFHGLYLFILASVFWEVLLNLSSSPFGIFYSIDPALNFQEFCTFLYCVFYYYYNFYQVNSFFYLFVDIKRRSKILFQLSTLFHFPQMLWILGGLLILGSCSENVCVQTGHLYQGFMRAP